MPHVNKSCILGLETYLVKNSRSSCCQFFGQWFMIGAIIRTFYLFIFALAFLCLFLVVFFHFFDNHDDLCSQETLICRFDFSKYLGLEFYFTKCNIWYPIEYLNTFFKCKKTKTSFTQSISFVNGCLCMSTPSVNVKVFVHFGLNKCSMKQLNFKPDCFCRLYFSILY